MFPPQTIDFAKRRHIPLDGAGGISLFNAVADIRLDIRLGVLQQSDAVRFPASLQKLNPDGLVIVVGAPGVDPVRVPFPLRLMLGLTDPQLALQSLAHLIFISRPFHNVETSLLADM